MMVVIGNRNNEKAGDRAAFERARRSTRPKNSINLQKAARAGGKAHPSKTHGVHAATDARQVLLLLLLLLSFGFLASEFCRLPALARRSRSDPLRVSERYEM
jgi:hypothetical protein